MNGTLLDTSALLCLRDDEAGATDVSALLEAAAKGGEACYGCVMSLMEVLYRVWKDEGEAAGRAAYSQCHALPVVWLHESAALLERAASLKATTPLSVADAWIAAAALEADALLIHKDPEFERVQGLRHQPLPYR